MVDDLRREADQQVAAALEALRGHIANRVRFEQLSDQLTGLPNEPAMLAAMISLLEARKEFWIAFVEVDWFKRINDTFGYGSADALLQKIAETLRTAASYFHGTTTAFRPHGDEFYLLGQWGDGGETDLVHIRESLELVRRAIAALLVKTAAGTVSCTVSVGWLCTTTLATALQGRGIAMTEREVVAALERTVGEAKWTRDCVREYSEKIENDETLVLRSDCGNCRCKFQVSVKRAGFVAEGTWLCPNCGTPQPRPPAPEKPVVPAPPTV